MSEPEGGTKQSVCAEGDPFGPMFRAQAGHPDRTPSEDRSKRQREQLGSSHQAIDHFGSLATQQPDKAHDAANTCDNRPKNAVRGRTQANHRNGRTSRTNFGCALTVVGQARDDATSPMRMTGADKFHDLAFGTSPVERADYDQDRW